MEPTKGPWHACNKGECPCKQVWSNDYPVAEVVSGKWGDDYPAIRLVGESSIGQKAEAYMEQITYGEVSEELAEANARLIAASPDLLEACEAALGYFKAVAIKYSSPEEIDLAKTLQVAIAKARGGQ